MNITFLYTFISIKFWQFTWVWEHRQSMMCDGHKWKREQPFIGFLHLQVGCCRVCGSWTLLHPQLLLCFLFLHFLKDLKRDTQGLASRGRKDKNHICVVWRMYSFIYVRVWLFVTACTSASETCGMKVNWTPLTLIPLKTHTSSCVITKGLSTDVLCLPWCKRPSWPASGGWSVCNILEGRCRWCPAFRTHSQRHHS